MRVELGREGTKERAGDGGQKTLPRSAARHFGKVEGRKHLEACLSITALIPKRGTDADLDLTERGRVKQLGLEPWA